MTVLETVNNSIVIRSGANFSQQKLEKFDSGNMGLKNFNLFRAGTFKDSMGIQRTWENEHLAQMLFHFNLLKDQGKFVDVPMREDHSGSIAKVVGYIRNLEHQDGFLRGDIEFTRPDAQQLWESGQWRARSAEVGYYETNEEALYWPVLLGAAFVDIGAVEGLYSKPRQDQDKKVNFFQVLQDDDKEPPVGADPKDNNTPAAPAAPAAPAQPAEPAPAAPPVAPVAPAEPAAQPAQHGAVQAHTFTVNGQTVSDFGAVQRHIDSLEQFRTDTVEVNRKNFVSGLASSNKILATQVEEFEKLAVGMTDEQYASFTKAYDQAPAQSILANHGAPTTGNAPGAPGSTAQTVSDEIEVLEETIKNHQRAGMPQEQIEKTASFKRLQQLQKSA